ncbi:MAG: glycerophosphodiester phosphodiesterase family protein [Acidimicrobiia bacterium]|nr:MAG: glycerophosphodiester phosphodiesterase family protein [Acidimicrobiia bacterium]
MPKSRTVSLVALLLVLGLTAAACQGVEDAPDSGGSVGLDSDAMQLPSGFDVQGHRGARGLKPENTLPAFETALDLGVSTLELDLHFSADGEVVVSHDPVIDPRKCGLRSGAPSDIPDPDDPATPNSALAVRSLTVEQLEWFRCDRNPDPSRFPDQDSAPTALAADDFGIITLDELIAFVERYAASESKTDTQRQGARVVTFNVETKRERDNPDTIDDGFDGKNVGPFEQRLLEVIEARTIGGRVVVQSFDRRSLEAIHRADASIRLAMLTRSNDVDIKAYAEFGASIWSPKSITVDTERVAEAHAAGLKVVPWTVNSLEEIKALLDFGVDGVITDRPDLLLAR